MRLDEAALDAYTDAFTTYALRHETLTAYDVTSDGGAYQAYLAGGECPTDFGAAWHHWIADRAAEGLRVCRVRVLFGPPTSYLRFEAEWGYTRNSNAGECIRVLDLTEQPRPPDLVDTEFWLMDGLRAAIMTYDDNGRFLYGDTAEDAAAESYRRSATAAWEAGEEFTTWWARHPQYHRDTVLGPVRRG